MIKSLLLITLSIMIGVTSSAVAYDNKFVHLAINKSGAKQSQQLQSILPNIGFPDGIDASLKEKEIWRWFQDGGLKEDEPLSRTFNHFHNPTRIWDDAGLKRSLVGCSSILWAQNKCNNANDKWSWQKAREYYYVALTSTEPTVKEQNFADTFRALGQQMHLLSDAAVPEHTRNDIHVFPLFDTPDQSFPQIGKWTYETWCKRNVGSLNTTATAIDYAITNNSLVSGLAPTSNFWDTTPSAGTSTNPIGLAEYTNFNFVSSDTIFKDFDYPQPPISFIIDNVPAKDGKIDKRVYFQGATSDGITINHLASTGYLWADLSEVSAFAMNDSKYELDDECFKDYAAILVPKAVAYSAALLDYFFRGTLEISAPSQAVYAVIDGSVTPQQFTKLKAKVRNTTPNEQPINGVIQAVAKYKKRTDYRPDLSTDPPTAESREAKFSYSVSAPINGISLYTAEPTEFTFDFTSSPIPAGVTDLYLQVIFKGSLGSEVDTAVAVGIQDLSEPTHIGIWNSTDRFYLEGVLYTADEIRNDPILQYRAGANYIDPYPINTEVSFCRQPGTCTIAAAYDVLPAGKVGRLIMLADPSGVNATIRDTYWAGLNSTLNYQPVLAINQDNGDFFTNTAVFNFRGMNFHSGSVHMRWYPDSRGIWEAPWPVAQETDVVPARIINQ